MTEGERHSRGRSRRRKGGAGRAVVSAVLKMILIFMIIAGLLFTGMYLYQYWAGNKTGTEPLETGRSVTPETMRLYR